MSVTLRLDAQRVTEMRARQLKESEGRVRPRATKTQAANKLALMEEGRRVQYATNMVA